MLAQRGGGDSDKLNPTHVTSSRALHPFDQRTRGDLYNTDDDDKLLDVVGPPQSPLLPLGQLSQFNNSQHAGKFQNPVLDIHIKYLDIQLSIESK